MKKGFTLIELAIVVVVLGILIGGIVTGQSIINTAKRQKVIKDVESYKTAFYDFYNNYNALPGDFDEGGDYFDLTSYPNQHSSRPNDNGRIEYARAESIMVWPHLAKAEILPNILHKHDGVPYPDSRAGTLGVNIPEAPWDGCGYKFSYDQNQGTTSHRNWLQVSSEFNGLSGAACVSAEDNKYIDEKIDDGHSRRGFVQGTHAKGTDKFGDTGATYYRCYHANGGYRINNSNVERGCVMLFDWELF